MKLKNRLNAAITPIKAYKRGSKTIEVYATHYETGSKTIDLQFVTKILC